MLRTSADIQLRRACVSRRAGPSSQSELEIFYFQVRGTYKKHSATADAELGKEKRHMATSFFTNIITTLLLLDDTPSASSGVAGATPLRRQPRNAAQPRHAAAKKRVVDI